jgi:hypothetical protein
MNEQKTQERPVVLSEQITALEEEADELLEDVYPTGVGNAVGPDQALTNRTFETLMRALLLQLRANRIETRLALQALEKKS